jgi:Ser/Thr protein kinase RdoA (MazF antagonist)
MQLSDFDASVLTETIPNFHHTPWRFEQLHGAVNADACGRVAEMQAELEFLFAREEAAGKLIAMRDAGELPLRVTHNDTKGSNVLFDDATGEALAVIDLDTVMPGLTAYDFGDAMRSGANTADEGEPDVSKVKLSMENFRAFTEGFLSRTVKSLTENELETLALGAWTITLEQAVRFLDDYLRGDTYYRTSHPGQNAERTRAQIAFVKELELHMDELRACVRTAAAEAIAKA